MALVLLCLLLVLLWCCLLVRHVSVGAWCFTTTPTLLSFMPMLNIFVILPSALPVQYTKFHCCIPGLITL